MRLPVPTPEEEPDDTGLGPSLVSKLKGFAGSLREGNVGDWVAENPGRVATVSETPPHAENTPRYGTVVLWTFGGGPNALSDHLEMVALTFLLALIALVIAVLAYRRTSAPRERETQIDLLRQKTADTLSKMEKSLRKANEGNAAEPHDADT
jgi:hypothetical protein